MFCSRWHWLCPLSCPPVLRMWVLGRSQGRASGSNDLTMSFKAGAWSQCGELSGHLLLTLDLSSEQDHHWLWTPDPSHVLFPLSLNPSVPKVGVGLSSQWRAEWTVRPGWKYLGQKAEGVASGNWISIQSPALSSHWATDKFLNESDWFLQCPLFREAAHGGGKWEACGVRRPCSQSSILLSGQPWEKLLRLGGKNNAETTLYLFEQYVF